MWKCLADRRRPLRASPNVGQVARIDLNRPDQMIRGARCGGSPPAQRGLRPGGVTRRYLLTLLFAIAPALALADEYPTAYDALRVVGTQFGRGFVNHIISVTGVEGTPQPERWKILMEDPRARGGVREVEVADGRIVSERTLVRSVAGSTEGATIKTTRLNLDSSGAYTLASHTADKSNTRFATVSYTLRTDEHGDPVWIVTLANRSGRPVGTIHIGANRGNVTRTEGMFAGASMEDVETDRDAEREQENEGGIIGTTKARIRETFRRAQDEARGMFERVRRSFVDFINRV
jgi:hypothetical protein